MYIAALQSVRRGRYLKIMNPHIYDKDIIARMSNSIITRVNTIYKAAGVMTSVSTNFFIFNGLWLFD
jgi:hypothetical protein